MFFVGDTITDLSAKKYLIDCLELMSAILTFELPLNCNSGFSNSSTDLKNSGRS